jgi:hypothetical protein
MSMVGLAIGALFATGAVFLLLSMLRLYLWRDRHSQRMVGECHSNIDQDAVGLVGRQAIKTRP